MNFLQGLVFALVIFAPEPAIATSTPTIEERIETTFNDKRMVKVLKCESQFQQFKNGKPLMSPTSDVGISQINQIHWKEAKALKLDIFNSMEDNLKMAKIIYDKEGIKAWTCFSLVYDE
jgi:hypothetical protein